jgi:cysteine desulfurase
LKLPVYFDHAATTPILPEVLDVMMPYFTTHYGNASSRHHAFGWLAEEALENANNQISKAFKINAKNIIFTSGATESINTILFSFAKKNPDGCIISCKTEHKATLDCLEELENTGYEVKYLPINYAGEIAIDFLKTMLKNCSGATLVSLLWVNNETGLQHPIDTISALKKEFDFEIHVDASQAVGKIPIDLQQLQIDYLTYSSHKIYGPKGIGVLISTKEIRKMIFGGSQQRNLRGGTLNIPAIVGIGKATEIAFEKIEKYNSHTKALQDKLESGLKGISATIKINSSEAKRITNISNIAIEGHDSETLIQKLSNKFALSNGSACNAASTFPSHVLKAMGQTDQEAFSAIRISFGWENNVEQVLDFIDILKTLTFK